jgi:hypothetical protein
MYKESTIERPDQGHLYHLGEPRDMCHCRCANLRPPAPQARTLPKELTRQLIAGYSEPLLVLRESATSSLHSTDFKLNIFKNLYLDRKWQVGSVGSRGWQLVREQEK